MKRLLTVLGFLYVSYAILTAYSALARIEATHQTCTYAADVPERGFPLRTSDRSPMDLVDEETFITIRDEYKIVLWVSKDCVPCHKFREHELGKLKKSGTYVQIKDTDEEEPEKGQKEVVSVPTIRVYRGKILVKEFVGYTSADDIMKVVKYRTVLLK